MELGTKQDEPKSTVGSLKVALAALEAFRAGVRATLLEAVRPTPRPAATEPRA